MTISLQGQWHLPTTSATVATHAEPAEFNPKFQCIFL